MAREKKQKCPPLALWLVTFSDLVTLLLTFFVLLLSMASMDQSFLTRVTVQPLDLGLLDQKGGGQLSIKLVVIAEMLENPWEVLEKQQRIKDMLYPDEMLPKDVNRSTLDKNLDVLAKDDGVAFVFTDKLLFPRGGVDLDASSQQLLAEIVPLLNYLNEPIRITGYTDDQEEPGQDLYDLSGDRALTVLKFFLEAEMDNKQFSIAGMGPNMPLASNETEAGRERNRRVEILVRTNRAIGGYM